MPIADFNDILPDGRRRSQIAAEEARRYPNWSFLPPAVQPPMGPTYQVGGGGQYQAGYGGGVPIQQRITNLVNSFDTAPTIGPQQQGSNYTPSMNWTGAGRPVGSVVATPKSTQAQTGVNTAYGQNNATNATAAQSLTDWTKSYLASKQPVQQYNDQETAAVGRFFNGGAAIDLARIRQNQNANLRAVTEQAYRRAGRDNSMRRLGAGNVGSSYMDRQYAQDLGGIAAQGAYRMGDQERSDQMYLDAQRMGQIGSRQSMQDRLTARDLMPAQVASGLQSDSVGRLAGIAGLDQGNNFYEPAENAYQRRLDFLQRQQDMGYYS